MLKKVIIASESAFRRTFLSEMLSSHKDIMIVDNIRNAVEALDIIKKKAPEFLILDIEFENEDWYKQFYPLLNIYSINTIVLTDISPTDLDVFDVPIILKSYDFILKPNGVWKEELPKIKEEIISKIILVDIPKIHRIDNKSRLTNKNDFIKQSQTSRAQKITNSSQIGETKIKTITSDWADSISNPKKLVPSIRLTVTNPAIIKRIPVINEDFHVMILLPFFL